MAFGQVLNVFFSFETWSSFKLGLDILQALVIIIVSVFTARWTFKTFGHKEKLTSLTSLLQVLRVYENHINTYANISSIKAEQVSDLEINQNYIDGLNQLLVTELGGMVRQHQIILEILESDLNLRREFKKKFKTTIEPVFEMNPNLMLPRLQRDSIFRQLRELIESYSKP